MPVTMDIGKFRKNVTERTRRDRINASIEQLRALFHQTRHISEEKGAFRLSKADVLEITVGFLKQKAFSRANSNYARGFSHCLLETLRHVTLHARLQPRGTEAVQRFYVRQRSRLAFQQVPLCHKPSKPSRSTAALWRPWINN